MSVSVTPAADTGVSVTSGDRSAPTPTVLYPSLSAPTVPSHDCTRVSREQKFGALTVKLCQQNVVEIAYARIASGH